REISFHQLYFPGPCGLLVLELLAEVLERRPSRIAHYRSTRAWISVPVFAAAGAQPLAILAADDLQRNRQQHLLSKSVLAQHPFALVVPDLRFRGRHGELFITGIRAQRTIQQIERP